MQFTVFCAKTIVRGTPWASRLGLIGTPTRLKSVSERGFDGVLHASSSKIQLLKEVLNKIIVFAVLWTLKMSLETVENQILVSVSRSHFTFQW